MDPVQKSPRTMLDRATEAGDLEKFLDALQTAELTRTLKGEGPFTVFAPSDDAFHQLSSGTLRSLLKKKNRAALQGILKHHIVEGRHEASDVAAMTAMPSLNGRSLQIQKKNNVLYVDDARVRQTNLTAENGVIHVIDRVLGIEEGVV